MRLIDICCGHRPFGCQSIAIVIQGWLGLMQNQKDGAARFGANAIQGHGGPSGTIVVSPAFASVIRSGVSRHRSSQKYQASGPECR